MTGHVRPETFHRLAHNTLATTACLALASLPSPAGAGNPTTHLHPEEGYFGSGLHSAYYAAVARRLLGNAAYRQCQAVFLPSFDVEAAVYVLRDEVGSPASPRSPGGHGW